MDVWMHGQDRVEEVSGGRDSRDCSQRTELKITWLAWGPHCPTCNSQETLQDFLIGGFYGQKRDYAWLACKSAHRGESQV